MKKLVAIVIFLSVLNSCNNDKWAEYSEPDFSGNSEAVYLEQVDSAVIAVPEKHYNIFQNCQIYHDSLLYAVSWYDEMRLSLYNLASRSFGEIPHNPQITALSERCPIPVNDKDPKRVIFTFTVLFKTSEIFLQNRLPAKSGPKV